MILRKTSLAQAVLARQDHDLSALHRRILILSDGRRSHQDIGRLAGAACHSLIAELVEAGYLSMEPESPAEPAQSRTSSGWLQKWAFTRAAGSGSTPIPDRAAVPDTERQASRKAVEQPPTAMPRQAQSTDDASMPFLVPWREQARNALAGCGDVYVEAFCELACTSTTPEELGSFLKGMLVYLSAMHPRHVDAFLQSITIGMPHPIARRVHSSLKDMQLAAA